MPYYTVKDGEISRLQTVWDRCFVHPYRGDDKKPGYLKSIKDNLAKCDENVCSKDVVQELHRIYDDFYQGYCFEGKLLRG